MTRLHSRTGAEGAEPGRIWSSHYGLGICLALYLAMAISYASLVPLLEGFDAEAYYRAATYFRSTGTLPALDEPTVQISYELVAQPPLYFLLAAAAAAGWPVEPSLSYAEKSRNPYFQKVLSKRQTVTLPNASWAAIVPIWSARVVSIVGGLLAVIATWILSAALFPQRSWQAIATTCLVALNPQFLFMSVTVTNDAWSVASIALTVALAARALVAEWPPQGWTWVGFWAGVAILIKYSGLLAAVPAGILWLLYAYRNGWRRGGLALLYVVATVVLVAGWWYTRLIWLYGEVLPLGQMATAIPTLRRPEPFTVAQTMEYVPWLISAYWGIFVANIAPATYLESTRLLMTIGFVGALLALVRGPRKQIRRALTVTVPWMGIVVLAVLYWTRTIDYGEQGRLAHIGAPAFALTWVLGWHAWFPLRWGRLVLPALASGALIMALSQAVTLHRAYAMPPAIRGDVAPDRVLDARFAAGMQVIGIDFPHGAAIAVDDPMPITLYFRTDEEIADFYTLFIHLADSENNLLWQFDGVPADGKHPTRQWRPGTIFADNYVVRMVQPGVFPLATLSMGFYPIASSHERLAVMNAAGESLADRLLLGNVRVHEQTDGEQIEPEDALATWQNGIELVDFDIHTGEHGVPEQVIVTWRARETLQNDLTVFVQLLDATNEILAQVDSQPQHGQYPTSTWRAGSVVADSYHLNLADSGSDDDRTDRAWSRLLIGFYDASGNRILLGADNPDQDAFVLARPDK